VTRWPPTRWGAALGACGAGALVVVLAAAAASADGRRGAFVFGVSGVALLAGALTIGSGAYPAALCALAASFAFSLAGHAVDGRAVVGAAALLLTVDQLAAWSFDAATGALERGVERWMRAVRIVAVVVIGSAVSRLVLSAGDLPVPGGFAAEAIGIAAALAVLGLVASRRWER